jgi:hypothetical protein
MVITSRLGRRAGIAAVSVAAAVAGGLAVGSPVLAAGPSYVYTQPGAPSAVALCRPASGCALNTVVYPANGTNATMVCWLDGTPTAGNYSSNRYFYVTLAGQSGQWLIHSSYVYYQTTVGRCS